MDRTERPGSSTAEQTAEAVPGARDPARLRQLVAAAHEAGGLQKQRLGGEINALLLAMRGPGNERAEVAAILEQLDLHALDGLQDAVGRSCRAEAVDTLTAASFPCALSVAAEDLAFTEERRRKARRNLWALPALGVGLFLGYLSAPFFSGREVQLRGTSPVLLGGFVGVIALAHALDVWLTRRRKPPGRGRPET